MKSQKANMNNPIYNESKVSSFEATLSHVKKGRCCFLLDTSTAAPLMEKHSKGNTGCFFFFFFHVVI